MKDREIQSRRRELEQWDTLLREKDRKLLNEQEYLEEKEENLRVQENKIRSRELDYEKKSFDLRQKESEATILMEKYHSLRTDLEIREKHCNEQTARNNTLSSNLLAKESALNSKDIELKNAELKFVNLTKQEAELNEKTLEFKKAMNHFYNYEVANITSRHKNEIKKLDEIINQQLQIGMNLQAEIDKLRVIVSDNEKEKNEWKKKEADHLFALEKLESDLKEMEDERDALKEQLAETMVLMFENLSNYALRPSYLKPKKMITLELIVVLYRMNMMILMLSIRRIHGLDVQNH